MYQSGSALDKPFREYKTNLSSNDNAPSQPVQKSIGKTKTISSANLNRQYYELPVLWKLRQALRAGNIWVEGSRCYARLESYLIPTERWNKEKTELPL